MDADPPDLDAQESPPGRRRGFKVAVVAVAVALVAAVAGIAATSGSSSAGYDTAATAFVLPLLDGHGDVKLKTYDHGPLVVNFFASWCTVCAHELPAFATEERALRGKVPFVEVDALETGNGKAFANRFGLFSAATAVARDVGGAQGSGLYQSEGGSDTMPLTVFYDNGVGVLSVPRGLSLAQLGGEVNRLYGVDGPT